MTSMGMTALARDILIEHLPGNLAWGESHIKINWLGRDRYQVEVSGHRPKKYRVQVTAIEER